MNFEPVSMMTMARVDGPEIAGLRFIIVGMSVARRWIVKDNRGRLGAVFRSADAALRFARREARVLGCSVMIEGGPVELDCLGL